MPGKDIVTLHTDNQAIVPLDELDELVNTFCTAVAGRTVDEWAAHIQPDLAQGVGCYIAAGQKFIAAKPDLKRQGKSFLELIEKLGQDEDTVERWMRIASNSALTDSAHARSLPTAWTTLAVLAALPPEVIAGYIKDGAIHVGLKRKDAQALVERSSERKSRSASKTTRSKTTEQDGPEGNGLSKQNGKQPTTSAGATVREDVGPSGHGEIERRLARADELERENRRLEIQAVGLRSENEELQSQLHPDAVNISHQRRLFRQALRSLQQTEVPNISGKEQRSLEQDAISALVELIRSAARDGLKVERIDLTYRPELQS